VGPSGVAVSTVLCTLPVPSVHSSVSGLSNRSMLCSGTWFEGGGVRSFSQGRS